MIETDTIIRMLVEISTGKPLARPDTAEEAAARLQLQKECDEIVAAGGTIDVPHEIPEA